MFGHSIVINNAGTEIASTNYFQSELARQGKFYLSWNASTARLLVPDTQIKGVDEMRTGRICVISRGKFCGNDGLELMFDDDSDAPYSVHMTMGSVDRVIKDDNKPFQVAAWTRHGKAGEWMGKYRVVKRLPFMQPWPKRK